MNPSPDIEAIRARAATVAMRLRRSSTVRRVVEDDVTALCDEVELLRSLGEGLTAECGRLERENARQQAEGKGPQ